MNLSTLVGEAGWLWLILAVGLGIAELLAPGVFLIFLAIAAAITGVATLVLADLSPVAQLASFGVWTAVAVLIGKRWYRDYPVESSDPLLNDRAARLIGDRSEEHTSELQSLMRISYAVFCLKKNKITNDIIHIQHDKA